MAVVDRFTAPIPWVGAAESDYLLCLLVFAASVVAYTAWGGFRAVVWTDMMQGVIMGLGVVILLGLALTQVGGLSNATQELSRQVPPRDGNATLVRMESDTPLALAKGAWLELPVEEKRQPFVRLKEAVEFPEGQTELTGVPVIEVRTSLKNATELKSIRAQVKDAGVRAQSVDVEGYQYGDDKPGVYVSAPGP